MGHSGSAKPIGAKEHLDNRRQSVEKLAPLA